MSDLYVEIKDQEHLMTAEGSKDTEPTKGEIEKAVLERGFIVDHLIIEFDPMQKMWRFYGDIEPAVNITIGSYHIKRINIDDFEISGPHGKQKKIICGGDFETILSTIFI